MSDYVQPRFYGLQEVLDAFERKAKTPYWSLWDKTQPVEQNNDDDDNVSIEKLTFEITQSAKHNYTRPLTLILHPKKEDFYDKNKSSKTAVIYFIATDNRTLGNYQPLQPHYNPALESRISALENARNNDIDGDDDDSDNDDSEMGMINGITKIIDHPLIAGLIQKFITPSLTPVQSLSGVNDGDDDIINTINLLFSKGVKLEHLQKLASMPQSKIQMLISML